MNGVVLLGCIVLAYLIGGIPFGYLIARARGVNIFEQGSGNIGATNVGRALGRKYGILVFVLDFLKGALPTLAARLLSPTLADDFPPDALSVGVAIAAVVGHTFPIYLRFRGGKGVATGAGVALVLFPLLLPLALLVWLAVVSATRIVSLASLVAAVCLCVLRFTLTANPLVYDNLILSLFCLLATALVFARHHDNIRKLLQGQERQFKDSIMLFTVGKLLHVLAVGFCFGMTLFFTFVVGLAMFATFKELGERDERPQWFPKQEQWHSRDLGPKLPQPGTEQGSRAFGHAVEPLFDWYFPLQMGCVVIALVTALGWKERPRLDRLRQIVLGLAVLSVAVGWWIEHKVTELRVPRNALTNELLSSPDPSPALIEQTRAARDTFGAWHGISLSMNFATVMLITVAMMLVVMLPGAPPKETPVPASA